MCGLLGVCDCEQRDPILGEVTYEMLRLGPQPECGRLAWVGRLLERVGGVERADDDEDARSELVQVAAVAVLAIEQIDRRREAARAGQETPSTE